MLVQGLDAWVLVGLFIAAFGAGLIDAMVGGGGLLQIPALFNLLPNIMPTTLLGTNKTASVVGTFFAARRYAKVIRIPWNAVLPAVVGALVGAFLGAYAVTLIDADILRLLLPILLVLVALYTFFRKDLGSVHAPRLTSQKERIVGVCTGLAIGLYDGFFGPGTGSFLMVMFVVFFGYDFLAATASAKVVNIACNLAALGWFLPAGHVIPWLGLSMAIFNLLGARVGAALAIQRGAGFVRKILLLVVFCLILKTGWSAYSPWLLAMR